MSKKIKVFYDGKCNICKREINFYSKIDKDKNFNWVNIHNNKEEIKNTGISKKELLSILHIQNEKGIIIKPINIFANFLYKLWLKTR